MMYKKVFIHPPHNLTPNSYFPERSPFVRGSFAQIPELLPLLSMLIRQLNRISRTMCTGSRRLVTTGVYGSRFKCAMDINSNVVFGNVKVLFFRAKSQANVTLLEIVFVVFTYRSLVSAC